MTSKEMTEKRILEEEEVVKKSRKKPLGRPKKSAITMTRKKLDEKLAREPIKRQELRLIMREHLTEQVPILFSELKKLKGLGYIKAFETILKHTLPQLVETDNTNTEKSSITFDITNNINNKGN